MPHLSELPDLVDLVSFADDFYADEELLADPFEGVDRQEWRVDILLDTHMLLWWLAADARLPVANPP